MFVRIRWQFAQTSSHLAISSSNRLKSSRVHLLALTRSDTSARFVPRTWSSSITHGGKHVSQSVQGAARTFAYSARARSRQNCSLRLRFAFARRILAAAIHLSQDSFKPLKLVHSFSLPHLLQILLANISNLPYLLYLVGVRSNQRFSTITPMSIASCYVLSAGNRLQTANWSYSHGHPSSCYILAK